MRVVQNATNDHISASVRIMLGMPFTIGYSRLQLEQMSLPSIIWVCVHYIRTSRMMR